MRETSLLRNAVRGQIVRRFAGLGDGDEEPARRRHELAVAELRGDVHGAGDARQLLHPIAGDAAGVVGGAACGDGDGAGVVQHRLRVDAKRLFQDPLAPQARFQRGAQRVGLFMDFLLHVVAVGALVRGVAVVLNAHRRAHHGAVAGVPEGHVRGGEVHQVSLLQEDEAVCHRAQRQRIRGDEVLADANAHHQRAAGAGGNDAARRVAGDHPQSVCALEPFDGLGHGFEEVFLFLQTVVDEVCDHFRIRA